MNILGVIPARGGSKTVPRKNIALIDGKPLIAYTIEEAQKVELITDLILSTEDEEIASIGENLGVNVPFIRPHDLATDQAQSAPVLKHALSHMEDSKRGLNFYDAVLMLQPTTPLRKSHHIVSAIQMMTSNPCDSVVSVVSVEGHHPFRMKRLIGNKLINLVDQGFEDMRPRQDLPKVYIRNGAIYLAKRDLIALKNTIVGTDCLGIEMDLRDSINIDTYLDFKMAEILLKESTN